MRKRIRRDYLAAMSCYSEGDVTLKNILPYIIAMQELLQQERLSVLVTESAVIPLTLQHK
jgi:hypothetical protein